MKTSTRIALILWIVMRGGILFGQALFSFWGASKDEITSISLLAFYFCFFLLLSTVVSIFIHNKKMYLMQWYLICIDYLLFSIMCFYFFEYVAWPFLVMLNILILVGVWFTYNYSVKQHPID